MITYQVGDITLEEFKPREWRAWRRLVEGCTDYGDEFRAGPDDIWCEDLQREVTGVDVRSLIDDMEIRRPVPLPSIGELAEVASIPEGVFKIAPSHQDVCDWLRALLPGYEEQLANQVSTASNLVSDIPDKSPVPADGWRPIDQDTPRDGSEFLAWDGSRRFVCWWHPGVNHRGKDQWTGGFMDANDGDDCPPMDEKPTHWQPLPPPPQEKGGEA